MIYILWTCFYGIESMQILRALSKDDLTIISQTILKTPLVPSKEGFDSKAFEASI